MKLVAKYLWSLVVFPFIFFLKGDLSFKMFMEVNQYEPITTEWVAPQKVDVVAYNIPIKPFPAQKNNKFTAEGFVVRLFDKDYNLLAESHVIKGYASFEIPANKKINSPLHVVCVKTADELTLNNPSKELAPLEIYEANLRVAQ